MTKKSEVYDGSSIKELPFPENVRTRPQMYVGPTTKSAQSTCLREILNNSVDEYLSGYANTITVTMHTGRSFTITDNGRGVPFDMHESKRNTLEVIFGALHAGRNFEAKTVYSTGLNGVGASCVNALSDVFTVYSRRNNDYGVISFNKGLVKQKPKVHTLTNISDTPIKTKTGTSVFYELDDSLFTDELSYDDVYNYLQEVSFLCTELKIIFNDCSGAKNKRVEFLYKKDEGLTNYLKQYAGANNNVLLSEPIKFSGKVEDTTVDVVFAYSDIKNENIISFCNTIKTSLGGSHVTGFKRSLSQNFSKYIKDNSMSKIELEPDDFRAGLIVFISVYSFNPEYTSQTKQELDMNKLQGHVLKVCNEKLKDWLSANAKTMKKLVELFILNAKGRLAQKRALENVQKENASLFSSISDMKKFADCITHGENAELFLVEGASAKGPCDEVRNKENQAVYALKGKPINAQITEVNTLLKNNEIEDIVSILKCGYGNNIDMEKLRFGKVIILSDADKDGKAPLI